MTDDTKAKDTDTKDILLRTSSTAASNSILSLDAFGEKKTGQVSLMSMQTASSGMVQDRGLAFGVFKGGGSALSHLVTDPISMVSQPMTTLQGLGNVSGMAHEMYKSASTAFTSGNSEQLGSFLGATVVNTALIGSAIRGGHGAAAGTAEARPFSQAAKFEAQVTARSNMLRSVESPSIVKTVTSEGLAEQSLKTAVQGSDNLAIAAAGGGEGSLVNQVLHGKPGTMPLEIKTPVAGKPTGLPELNVGATTEIGTGVRIGEPPKLGVGNSGGVTVTGALDDVAGVGKVRVVDGTLAETVTGGGKIRLAGEGEMIGGKVVQVGEGGRAVVSEGGKVLGEGRIVIGENGARMVQFTDDAGRLVTLGDDIGAQGARTVVRQATSEAVVSEFKGARVEGIEIKGIKVQEGSVVNSSGHVLSDTRVLSDGKVFAEGKLIGQMDDVGRVIATREVGVAKVGGVEVNVVAEMGPRSRAFASEEAFVSGRTSAARTLEEVKASGVQPSRVESFTKTLDDYAKAPTQENFVRLKAEWQGLEVEAKTARVPEGTMRQLQSTVEKAIGAETQAGARVTNFTTVEQPKPYLNERPVAVQEQPVSLQGRQTFAPGERVNVVEQPTVVQNRVAPVEQPTWKATNERLGVQLEEVRTTVRESGGSAQVVNKLDDAVQKYAKEPTTANLQELNTAFREVESASTIRGGRLTEQLSEVRQNIIQHMPPEHAAIARIEAAAAKSEASFVSAGTTKVTENIAQSAEKMRTATTVDDFVRESRNLEKNVTKYLTEEVKAGRMSPQEALDIQRATRTLQQEAQVATTTAIREQAGVMRFKNEPAATTTTAEIKATEVKVVEGKPVVEVKPTDVRMVDGKPVVEVKASDVRIVDGKPVVEFKGTEIRAVEGKPAIVEGKVAEVKFVEGKPVVEVKLIEGKPVIEGKSLAEIKAPAEPITFKAPTEPTTIKSATTAEQVALREKMASENLGVKAPEYQVKIDAARDAFKRITEATDDAARIRATAEFRTNAAEANKIIKEAGAPKPVADTLSIDIRSSLQQARVVRVATELEKVTAANTEFVTAAQRAIKDATIPEPVRTQLRAQVHTFESHVNGLTSTETQWGTRAGEKALQRQIAEMEKSFQQAGIDFAPFRGRATTIEAGLESYRTARQASTIGDKFLSPVKEFAYANPIIGKPIDFLWNNPTVLKVYMGIGVAEVMKGLVTAAEYGRAAKEADKASADVNNQASVEAGKGKVQNAQSVEGVSGTTTYTVREEAARVADKVTQANAAVQSAVGGNVVAKEGAGKEVAAVDPARAVAAGQTQEAVLPGQPKEVLSRVSDDDNAVVTGNKGQVLPGGPGISHALFSMPMSPQERRAENRRMYGGLDVDYVYFAKGPGASPVENVSAPMPIASTIGMFSTSITEPADRERPTNNRFDWKRTRLDPNALSRPDGFYMSTQYMGPDARNKAIRGGGSSKQDEQGSNGLGAFAKKYAFLAQTADRSKGGNGVNSIAAGTENAEALNPDNSGGGTQAQAPILAANINADPDQGGNATTTAGTPDDEQPVLLT